MTAGYSQGAFFIMEGKEVCGIEFQGKLEGVFMNVRSVLRIIAGSVKDLPGDDSEGSWDGPELSAILEDVLEAAEGRLQDAFMELAAGAGQALYRKS